MPHQLGELFAIVAHIGGVEIILYKLTAGGATPMIAETASDIASFFPTANEIRRKSGLPWYVAKFSRATGVDGGQTIHHAPIGGRA